MLPGIDIWQIKKIVGILKENAAYGFIKAAFVLKNVV
jgi:hypothetical protein